MGYFRKFVVSSVLLMVILTIIPQSIKAFRCGDGSQCSVANHGCCISEDGGKSTCGTCDPGEGGGSTQCSSGTFLNCGSVITGQGYVCSGAGASWCNDRFPSNQVYSNLCYGCDVDGICGPGLTCMQNCSCCPDGQERTTGSTYNYTYQMGFGPGPEGPELLNCSVPNDEYLSTSNPKYGCVWIDEDDGTELCWRTNVCRTAICIVPETPTPTPTNIPTPTPIPPPTLTCTAYTNPVSIVWNWTVNSPLTYLLYVWNSTATIVYNWYTGPTVTTSATPGVTQWGRVLSGDGTQSSPWSNTASCTIPALSTPTGTCGTFDPVTATTPVTWTWANGTGLQVTKNSPPSSNPAIENWLYNAAALSGKVISGVAPGTLMYARTTYVNEFSAFSSDGRIQPAPYYCPLPTNQTAIISGVLRQKSGTGCYQADASNNFNVTNLTGSTGDSCVTIKTPCTFSLNQQHAVSYSCTVTWDNQACVAQGRQPNTTQTLTLTSGATGYSSGQFTNASCTPINPPPNDKKVTVVAEVNSTADIAFTFSGSNWIKLKNSSYNGVSITGITVPAFVTSYDADDNGSKYFAIGNAGSILNTTVSPSSAYSTPNNWYAASYTKSSSINPSTFLNYVKSRKEYQTVSAMSSINQEGIYLWSGDLTLNNINLNQATASKFVLIVDGNVTIDQDKFNIDNCTDASGLKKIAILSKTGTIAFSTSTQCAAGVFIAQTVNTGAITSQGLKIKGNLIAQTTLTNGRAWSDTSKPGLFVVFDPVQYINLLPYLSTAYYDWRQIQ